MNKLDFLNGSPNTLIFGQKASKTRLGGVLTLIYLIIVLIISIVYIFDYAINSKYTVLYVYEQEFFSVENALKRLNQGQQISFSSSNLEQK